MKYRIVKTESGDYRIQESFFGLFWLFTIEPRACYSEYRRGFVKYDGISYLYNNKNEAERAIKTLKEGSEIYRKYYIDQLRVDGEYKYFVSKKFFDDVYYTYYDTLDEAKASIDEKYQEKERKDNKRKVKEVVKYY